MKTKESREIRVIVFKKVINETSTSLKHKRSLYKLCQNYVFALKKNT